MSKNSIFRRGHFWTELDMTILERVLSEKEVGLDEVNIICL